MRLVTYATSGTMHAGVLTDAGIAPIHAVAPHLPDDVVALIGRGHKELAALEGAVAQANGSLLPLDSVSLKAPIPRPPRNIFCVGKNYYEHASEFEDSGFDATSSGQAIPDAPIVFTKAPSSVIGTGDQVESRLDPTSTLDYEGELGVVIGTGGRAIRKADAIDHVFGYTIINDITARETQNRHKQWFLGKSPDTFCPMGPVLVTADEIADLGALHLTTSVNGEVRQDAYVRDLIFDVPTIIETISAAITLQPGDIIATGTPAGVAIGFKPPRYLRPGDRVDVTIEGIGTLSNEIA